MNSNDEGSSLIWVHSVCIIGHKNTVTDNKGDDNCREW